MRDCLSEEVRTGSTNGHRPPPIERIGVDAISILDYIGNTPLFLFCGLTRHLRTHGAQNGCILTLPAGQSITNAHVDEAITLAKAGIAAVAG